MSYVRRSYQGRADQQQMRALVEAAAAQQLDVVDLPYRFSSWAFDSPEQISLWFTSAGQLHAWACLQTPFWSPRLRVMLRRSLLFRLARN